MILNLGRSGASVRLALELVEAAGRLPGIEVSAAISAGSANAEAFAPLGRRLLRLDTFDAKRPLGVIINFPRARRALLRRLAADPPAAVITVMPHVWTPLLAAPIRRLGIRYATIIHDAATHPGDRISSVTPWLLSEIGRADLVVTLSRTVTGQLARRRDFKPERAITLFHPDITYPGLALPRRWPPGRPLRLLFFGRVLPYKGLSVLVEAVRMLRQTGLAVELGVAGAGDLEADRARLEALGAEIMNRWFGEDEIGPLLSRYDAMALPYLEASQSGVAAVAFAGRMPVLATPVGGLAEQVEAGRTGILAAACDAPSFAAAIRELAEDRDLYDRIVANLEAQAGERSMARFAACLMARLSSEA